VHCSMYLFGVLYLTLPHCLVSLQHEKVVIDLTDEGSAESVIDAPSASNNNDNSTGRGNVEDIHENKAIIANVNRIFEAAEGGGKVIDLLSEESATTDEGSTKSVIDVSSASNNNDNSTGRGNVEDCHENKAIIANVNRIFEAAEGGGKVIDLSLEESAT